MEDSRSSSSSSARGIVNAMRMLSSMLLPAGAAGQFQQTTKSNIGQMFEIPVNIFWQPTIGELMSILTLLISIVSIIGCCIGWYCRGKYKSKAERLLEKKKIGNQKVTKSTQSQTTYKWKYTQPRFMPVGEHAQGAWSECYIDTPED